MNYPYLSVETEVSPATIGMNDTVDVTIRLKGDGYELQPDPIDVVLCTDRSGSMLKDYPDRMVKAMEASEIFNAQMNYPRDHLGLVSFGKNGKTDLLNYGNHKWLGEDSSTDDDSTYRDTHYPADGKTYADYATVDLSMSDNATLINTTIKQMVPDWGTPMRFGIYKAINELIDNGRDNTVKAVIVLSDGDYNHYGDPLARGDAKTKDPSEFSDLTVNYLPFDGLGSGSMSNQNMSVYAMNNNIRIYSIAFANDISDGGKNTLKVLAESTGGKYYHAPTGDDLAQVYTDIAGELKTEAGVNTTMTVFNNVELNETPVDAFKVFDYRYQNGVSTYILNKSGNGTTLYEGTIDQTPDWNTNHNLHFDIGTIHLNQVWEARIQLAVNSSYEGSEYNNINIFGPGASLSFNNGEDTLALPDTFLTVLPDLNNTGITSAWLEVDLEEPELPPGQDSFTDTVPLTWTITYNGTRDIHETLAYSKDDRLSWTVFWTGTVVSSTTEDKALLDASNLPAGDYCVRLTASADDAPDAVDMTGAPIHIGSTSRAYIKIE